MKKISLLLLIAFSIHGYAQTWRSSLYPTTWTPPSTQNFYTDAFLQDYSYAGYHRGEKAPSIPNIRIFDVSKSPYNADKTGLTDATTAIQTAINDAQTNGGGIIYLPAGTYQVNPGTKTSCLQINKSNIFIKGDGVGQTFILNKTYQMKNKAIISVSGSSSSSWTSNPSTKALLTRDVMNPTTIIPVDNPSMFNVGDLIVIRNFINDSWITEHKETDWLGYGSNLMGLMYCRYITAIDVTNKTITIDVPVRYALKTRDGACAFKLSGMISEVGLSDFSIANIQHPSKTGYGETDYNVSGTGGYDCDASYVIKYNTVVNSWIKNVETYKPASNTTGATMLSNGILVQFSKNVTIDNCNFNHAQYGGGNGNGYAYRVSANEVLISNSTSYFVRHGFVFSSMWCSGNVFHNCKDIKTGTQCGSTGNESTSGSGSDHHMHFSQSNLIDQSYSENSAFLANYRPYGSAPMHRLTSTHTAYWNTSSAGTNGYCIWTQQSRYGYAIGTSGTSSGIYTKETATGSSVKTDPVDIVQGQGTGATLQPQSLYLDQLQKRLSTGAAISASGPTTLCSGGNVVLTATAGSSYTWYNGSQVISGATAQNYTATTTGQYKVDVMISGIKSTSPIIDVTVNPLPTATITSTSNSFCAGGSLLLTASTGSSYKWFNGTTQVGTAATYTAAAAGSYTVEVTNAAGCKATSAVKTITVDALPTAIITSASNSFCAGGSLILTASTGVSYKWFNGTTQVGTAATYTAAAAGSYTVEVTNAAGCKATSAVKTITVDALPTATITSPANSFCQGSNVVLTASAGASYKWFRGTTLSQNIYQTFTATVAGDYTVEVTNIAGCKATSAVKTITVDALPAASITSASNSFCAGSSLLLTASTGASYKWFNGTTQVGTAATYTAAAAGSYTVEVTNTAGCKATSAIKTITVDALPAASITSASNSFCAGGSLLLTASTGTSYKWFNGTTQVGTAATYTAAAAGSYTVEVTNTAGCKATSAVKTITVDALPTATITSPANSFCQGSNVVLTASAGASYKWFNGTTQVGTAATYTAAAAGAYTVEVTNTAGCKNTSAVKTITVDALPTTTITSPANSFCAGGSLVLTASTGASYNWFNGTTQVGTAATYTSAAAGAYTVEVTNAAGCKATSAVKTITIDALPAASITSPANSFCAGGSLVLTASTGDLYKWFNGTTQVGTAATYTAAAAGSYTVEVTNAAGCKNTSAVKTITVDASSVWYADTDGDGKGDPSSTVNACVQPQGYVSAAGDACPTDENKIDPGICGCTIPESQCTNQVQTITFSPFNETQHIGDPDFVLTASSSSGLPLTYTSSNTSVAVIIGNTVHIVGAGTTTITISQAGNSIYASASVSQDLVIQPLTTGTLSMLSSEAIELYPNPGSEMSYLDFKGTYDEVIIKIYSIEGKEVYRDAIGSVSNNLKEISLTGFPSGIYFIEIQSKQGKLIKRLIKK